MMMTTIFISAITVRICAIQTVAAVTHTEHQLPMIKASWAPESCNYAVPPIRIQSMRYLHQYLTQEEARWGKPKSPPGASGPKILTAHGGGVMGVSVHAPRQRNSTYV